MSLRMLWSLATILIVAVVAIVMMISIANIEKQAWKQSETDQATLLITLLADELKMPMVSVAEPEVSSLIKMFRHRVDGVEVVLQWAKGSRSTFTAHETPDTINHYHAKPAIPTPIEGAPNWYAISVNYNNTYLGTLLMKIPGKAWHAYDLSIKKQLTIMAAITALIAALLVYAMSGRIVRRLRYLAQASKRVGSGDFSVQLPIDTSNEFGKAFHQFNKMVANLEQREKVFDLYGGYQKPQLVADEYDRLTRTHEHITREISVLAVEMIDFEGYLKTNEQADCIALLNRCFNLFYQIASSFGGHVVQVSGARMIIVFNHPFDLKCHENQAAKAGIAILAGAKKLALKGADGSALIFRAGMATGEVSVGHLGVGRRRDFTVVGEPIDRAEQLAHVGDGRFLTAQYGTMLELGHGFKQKDLGQQTLQNGQQMRCILIAPGEAYVVQEVEEIVAKALLRAEPEDAYIDEGW